MRAGHVSSHVGNPAAELPLEVGADGTKSTRGSSKRHCSDAAPLDASHHAQHPTACPQSGLGGRLASSLLLKDGSIGVPSLAAAHPPDAAQNHPSTSALVGLKPIKTQHIARGRLAKEGARQMDTTGPWQEHRAQVSAHRPGLPNTGPTPEPADSLKQLLLESQGLQTPNLIWMAYFFFFCCALVG